MKRFKYIQKEIFFLEELSNKYQKKITPCTVEEIRELESILSDSYHLSQAYKEFLLSCGKNMAEVFDPHESGYIAVKKHLQNKNEEIKSAVEFYSESEEIPSELLVIETVEHCANYTYLLLTEGNNPPVYFWEEGRGGLDFSKKLANSFSDYLLNEITIKTRYLMNNFMSKKIRRGEIPRGKQLWIPEKSEYSLGIIEDKMFNYFGLGYQGDLDKVITIFGSDSYSYLEELSGWKAKKVGDEIRFFPPSNVAPNS